MFSFRKKPVRLELTVLPDPEDEFARSAMQALLMNQKVQPGTMLAMDLETIAEDSYRIAQFMMRARTQAVTARLGVSRSQTVVA